VGAFRAGEGRTGAFGLIGLVALAVLGPSSRAHTPISRTIFRIEASNEAGSGSYIARFNEGVWDAENQTFEWTLAEPVDLVDEMTQQWVASLIDATVFVRAAQVGEIELNIGVISGESLTTFVIGSPLLSFSPVIPADLAQGRADASLTVTDGLGDGAEVIGLGPPGSGAYRAYYSGYLEQGTRFSHLVGRIAVGGGGTATGSQADPAVGYRLVGAEVSDMSTEIAFTLTASDLAYAVTRCRFPVPEPCFGDVNGDGLIDVEDLSTLLGAFGSCEGDLLFDPHCDLEPDGCIDMADLVELLGVYGEACP
jgi:hypothetical protein